MERVRLSRRGLRPQPMTESTRRLVAALTKAAERLADAVVVCIETPLTAFVRLILFVNDLREKPALFVPPGFYRGAFVCPWCGGLTREGEIPALSCCSMSLQSYVRDAREASCRNS